MTIIAECDLDRVPPTAHVLDMWTIYDHPTDRPERFVARRHEATGRGSGETTATGDVLMSEDIEELRALLRGAGRVLFQRAETDDPVIVETWM